MCPDLAISFARVPKAAVIPTPPEGLSIVTQPNSQTILTGSTVALSVVATGEEPLSYQWYEGLSGDTSSPVVGETLATFTTPALTVDTSYWVRVSNLISGSVDSVTADITVVALPEDVLGPPVYLGALRISQTGIAETVFTFGGLAGRVDGGVTKLYIVGNEGGPESDRGKILEIIDPGSGYSTNYATAPIATTNVYSNGYRDKRFSWVVGGGINTFADSLAVAAGLYWDGDQDRLFMCFDDTYDTGSLNTHCLLSIELHPGSFSTTGYGPWSIRTSDRDGTVRRGAKAGMWLSKHPVTNKMMVSSTITSGDAGCTWGPSYHTGADFPTDATPTGAAEVWNIPNIALWYYFMGANEINTNGTMVSGHTLRSFRRRLSPAPYEWFPEDACSPADQVLNVDPALYSDAIGATGSWRSGERSYGMMYIQIGTKAVYLSTAELIDGHNWYRNECRLQCTHGVDSVVDVTGPTTTSAFPALIGYDPADIADALAHNIEDWEAEPAYCVNMETEYPGIRTLPISIAGGPYKSIEMGWFDETTRKLYLHAPRADDSRFGDDGSLIHVFQFPAA